MPSRRSIRFRLTAWYAGILAITLIMTAAGSLLVLSRVLATRHDRFLDEALGAYIAELSVEYGELGTTQAAATAAVRDTRFNETWIFVFDSSSALLARGDAARQRGVVLPEMPTAVADSIARTTAVVGHHTYATFGDGDDAFRVALTLVPVGGQALRVAATQSRLPLVETIEQVGTGYLVVVPFVLVASALGGYVLARRALAPIVTMASSARTIGAKNLNERLTVPPTGDEVAELGGVINELLTRLEGAFALQRRFVADASHELRTPVATVFAEADIALSAESRSEPEYRESLTIVRNAGRRLARVVEELFVLARIDAGHLPLAADPLYLDELVAEVARSLRTLAQRKNVAIRVDAGPEVPLTGDARLLERLVLNLLDNAIKFSPPGGQVYLRLARADRAVSIVVSDEGPGIPRDEAQRVFERFVRLDASRSPIDGSLTGGAGLGLSIARWVAEAHGGTLVHRSPPAPPGSEFVAVLPLEPTGPAS